MCLSRRALRYIFFLMTSSIQFFLTQNETNADVDEITDEFYRRSKPHVKSFSLLLLLKWLQSLSTKKSTFGGPLQVASLISFFFYHFSLFDISSNRFQLIPMNLLRRRNFNNTSRPIPFPLLLPLQRFLLFVCSIQIMTTTTTTSMNEVHAMSTPTVKATTISNPHAHFAGRFPAGITQPITLSKNGNYHIRRLPNGEEREVLAVGLACSECFSGSNLYRILKPGMDFEQSVMEQLLLQQPATSATANGSNEQDRTYVPSLSIHTSAGLPDELEAFLNALKPHLPWKNGDNDWICSLQLEGASAVWAAIDMCLQVSMIEEPEKNKERKMVAVGRTSYHGPPSTSFGGAVSPLWTKHYQINYPSPLAGEVIDEEKLLSEFQTFLDTHGDTVGVILIEPQWGSSQAGMPWPKSLVQNYIEMSKRRGIKVVCDEIMCGLGRHGHGTFFVSEAWDLDPDCITFGKAIGGGSYQLAGAVLKTGRDLLSAKGKSVLQSHTYAGSSTRALMTATEVLKELPNWFTKISDLGIELGNVLQDVEDASDGMIMCHGQGLMWGGLFRRNNQFADVSYRTNAIKVFQKHCDTVGILPYHVPVGGFMLSPVLDIQIDTIHEIGSRLKQAIILTKDEIGWVKPHVALDDNLKEETMVGTTSTIRKEIVV